MHIIWSRQIDWLKNVLSSVSLILLITTLPITSLSSSFIENLKSKFNFIWDKIWKKIWWMTWEVMLWKKKRKWAKATVNEDKGNEGCREWKMTFWFISCRLKFSYKQAMNALYSVVHTKQVCLVVGLNSWWRASTVLKQWSTKMVVPTRPMTALISHVMIFICRSHQTNVEYNHKLNASVKALECDSS